MKKFSLLLVISFTVAQTAFAGMDHPAPVMPKEFEAMKQLVGTWEGTAKMGDKDMPVSVVYSLTSGGTVLTERTMAGTPHEMITVYYKDGKGVAMTHYCSAGNRPHMKLAKSTDQSWSFDMGNSHDGLGSAKEEHMHALTLSLADANSLKEDWTSYNEGKLKGNAVFNLKRKQ